MATYHIIYVTTKVQNRKKNEMYSSFEKCENARRYMEVPRMAGKIKEFVGEHCLEEKWHGEDYNGYGWSTHIGEYLMTLSKAKELQALVEGKKIEAAKKVKTEEEKEEAWAKRLSKLTGISMEKAKEIAIEKYNAKVDQINALISRDCGVRGASVRRGHLIRMIERSNPLRYIKNKEHAMAILAASYRHNSTDYDELLEENRWEASMGNMDYEDVRSDARAKVAAKVAEGVARMVSSI